MSFIKHWQLLLLPLVLTFVAFAQSSGNTEKEKVKVDYRADILEKGSLGDETFKKLLNNVVFKHIGTIIYSDSAYFYDEKNVIEAFGHVKIVNEDSSQITAKRLHYNSDTRIARLRQDVVYKSDSANLYTDKLDYNAHTKVGHFFDGGILMQANNTLSSNLGYYNNLAKVANFYDSVELVNPEYFLQTDTLTYNTLTKIAYFRGPTTIIEKKDTSVVYTDTGGEYNTTNKTSIFSKTEIETKDYILSGDYLKADEANQVYIATGNVALTAKENDVTITGTYGRCWQDKGIAKVYGSAVMQKILDKDTLYLAADTLLAIQDTYATDSADHLILAYKNVKIYKNDLQGIADSMAYHGIDSTIYFYTNPIFWANNSQMTADSINMVVKNKGIDKMYMHKNVFLVEEDSLKNYNQTKGRDMVVSFQENKIDCLAIAGNGQSIYFAIDAHGGLMGMNYIQCSHMRMQFENNGIANIAFYIKPTGVFYPPHEITKENQQLKGFSWRITERPTKADVLGGYAGKEDGSYKAFKFKKKSNACSAKILIIAG